MGTNKKKSDPSFQNHVGTQQERETISYGTEEKKQRLEPIPKKKASCKGHATTERAKDQESWLSIESTQEISDLPEILVDQIIGQDEAKKIIRIVAKQRRNVLLIGPPGTGKSMLGRAYAELMNPREKHDLLAYPNFEDPFKPRIVAVPKGKGEETITRFLEVNETFFEKLIRYREDLLFGVFAIIIILQRRLDLYLLGLYALLWIMIKAFFPSRAKSIERNMAPWLILDAQSTPDFIDATGLKAGGLFGDVLHDPYQSGGLETPPHKRLIIGAVQKAHNGVLYIDEAGNLDLETQIELLSVLQDRECPIRGRTRESTASTIHTDPIPADFSLVIAGNVETIELLHPALRSRLLGYGYEVLMKTVMPDTIENRKKLVRFIAQEIRNDGRIPHFSREAVLEIIQVARIIAKKPYFLTLELRKLAGIIRSAGDLAKIKGEPLVRAQHVFTAYKLTLPVNEQIRIRPSLSFQSDTRDRVYFPVHIYLCNYDYVRVFAYKKQTNHKKEIDNIRILFSEEVPQKFRSRLYFHLSSLKTRSVINKKEYFIEFSPQSDAQVDETALLAILIALLKSNDFENTQIERPFLALGMIDASGKIITQFAPSEVHKAIESFPGKVIISDSTPCDHEKLVKVADLNDLITVLKQEQ